VARTGTFGRVPRSAPSITSTLIALAHEQEQEEDNNIMSAWQKGGLIDGHKVTDEMVLKHWQDRLKDISTDDPLYDQFSNAVKQYEYSIAESKMTAQYAQIAKPSAGDDQKMSAFYMNWAKKIPKDSEFYRILLRDAGQYIRSAKAKQEAGKRQDTEKIYRDQMNRLEAANEKTGQNALRVITMLGQEGSRGSGAVLGETPLGAAGGIVDRTNLASLGTPDAAQMIALLQTVSQAGDHLRGPNAADRLTSGNPAVLYHDENGKAVTGTDIVNMFKQSDPSFNGKFDMSYIQSVINRQRDGIQKRMDLAKKTGHISEYIGLSQDQAKINEYGREIAAWPVAVEYSRLSDEMDRITADNSLLPPAKAAALARVRAQIGTLADDKRIAADGHMQSQLRAEASGQIGTPTLADDLGGLHDSYAGDTSNTRTAQVNDLLELYDKQNKDVQSGAAVMTQGAYQKGPDGKLTFVPQTNGPSVGAATMDQINNLPGNGKAVPVMIPNGDGAGATVAYVVPAPIYAKATGERGEDIPASNSNPVGGFIRYKVNGVDTTLYSISRPDGTTSWTYDPPWDQSKVKAGVNGQGAMVVDLDQSVTPTGVNLFQDGAIGKGWAVVGSKPATRTEPAQAGHLQFDPQATLYSTDQARQYAGHDPVTDSFSASLASFKTAPDGAAILRSLSGDPTFEAVLDNNARLAAGMTYDANWGVWTGGNQAAYESNLNSFHADLNRAKNGNDLATPDINHRDSWTRDTTDTTMSGASGLTVPGPNGQAMILAADRTPLATNVLGNSDGERSTKFAALASAFTPSGQLQTKAGEDTGMNIKMGQPLTVPTPPAGNTTPSFFQPPAPTVAPPSTTYKPPTVANQPPPTVGNTSGYGNTGSSGYGNTPGPKKD
jgi:hypothetical protein